MCELTIEEYNKLYNTNLPDNHHEITLKELNLESNINMNNTSNPPVIWFTGLPQSGKSTILAELDKILEEHYIGTFIIDNDYIKTKFCHDYSDYIGCNDYGDYISHVPYTDHVVTVAEVAHLASHSGCTVLTTALNPFHYGRTRAKEILGDLYIEVFVKCPLHQCVQRDTKDYYAKVLLGDATIKFEEPLEPTIVIDSGAHTAYECAQIVFDLIKNQI